MTRVFFVAGLMFVLTAAMAMPARAADTGVQAAPAQTGGTPGTAAHAGRPPLHHVAVPHNA